MENWLNREAMTSMMLELVRVPSISGTRQEQDMSGKVAEMLGRIEYFAKHPHLVFQEGLKGDPLERSFVAALLQGSGKSGKTVILLNHFDVVDTEDYGELADLAFSPGALGEALRKMPLTPRVKEDLESGRYLFGRGTADMKAGIALQLAALQHFSSREEALEGNLLFLSLPDEEGSSRGAMEALPFLRVLKERFHLTYEAVINCEPAFPEYPGDEGRYIYTGSMGKAVAMFYCYGKEAHVGETMSGLNGHLLAAEICRLLEGNTDFCETLGAVVTPPPSCLKHMDFKRLYSVQIPHNAASYYNLFLLNRTPPELLKRLKDLARRAFHNVLESLEGERKKFSALNKSPFASGDWKAQVYTYEEFFRKVWEEKGDTLTRVLRVQAGENPSLDLREKALRMVDRLHLLTRDKSPKIIVGFLPPYYPSVTVTGRNEKEARLLAAVDALVQGAGRKGQAVRVRPSFQGLSDLSFFNFHLEEDPGVSLEANMPGYGMLYHLPLKEMAGLQVPVLNLSLSGKDPHKFTERIELFYSFEVLPPLLIETVERLVGLPHQKKR